MDWITTFLIIIGLSALICLGVSALYHVMRDDPNPASENEPGIDSVVMSSQAASARRVPNESMFVPVYPPTAKTTHAKESNSPREVAVNPNQQYQ